MRGSVIRRFSVLVVSLMAFGACDRADEATSFAPAGPGLAARTNACNFGRMAQDARSYFPGNGNGSISATVLGLVDQMKNDCAAGNRAGYTAHWFQVAGLVESVLEAGTGGDPADGASFLAKSITVVGPDAATPIFDPCAGAPGCMPWDGYPALPSFASVLGATDGAWAVVSGTGTEVVCSGFVFPCASAAKVESGLGDVWGVKPSPSWSAALLGRTSVLFGYPLPGPSPTGEALLNTDLPAFQFLLIPDLVEFGTATAPGELQVGLCSSAFGSGGELLVQKGSTILNEVSIADWCMITQGVGNNSLLHRLASFLSPAPSPLVATVASSGPGGRAGSFTDFYAVGVPQQALIGLSSQPADGTVGQVLMGKDGQPFSVRTFTSSMQSPLENAHVFMTVIGNGGLIPSGNDVSATGLTCVGFDCDGFTQADEDLMPGSLLLPLKFTKTGSYSLCFTADMPPLTFTQVCTDKFNIRP